MQQPHCDECADCAELLPVDEHATDRTIFQSRRSWKLIARSLAALTLLCGLAGALALLRVNKTTGSPDLIEATQSAQALFTTYTLTFHTESRGTCQCNCQWADRRGLVASGCAHDDGGCCFVGCCSHVQHHSAQLPYDCEAGLDRAQDGWSVAKKQWCCENRGRGCPENAQLPYDCNAGLARAQDGWSVQKKQWCCDHAGKGCSDQRQLPYDCDAGLARAQDGWSVDKKQWCCDHSGKGCPVDAQIPYNCRAGRARAQDGWSVQKKQYCCAHQGLGCPGHVELAYNCNSREAWSEQKQSWCCNNEGKGCSYDCHAGVENAQAGWSVQKKQWCCEQRGLGCHANSAIPYDCNAGILRARDGWSVDKKTYCCQHEHKGCPDAQLPFDCNTGLARAREGWSADKKSWCCANQRKGCPDDNINMPYDCNAGASNAQSGWSIDKKTWCCHTLNQGCDNGGALALPYDCDAGYARRHTGWSDEKKTWCCKTFSKGCDAHERVPYVLHQYTPYDQRGDFDCNAGYARRSDGWSDAKKSYCCRNELKGCFDSEFPFLPWQIVLWILCAGICCVSTILCCRENERSSSTSRTPQSFTAVVNDTLTPAPKPWYQPSKPWYH